MPLSLMLGDAAPLDAASMTALAGALPEISLISRDRGTWELSAVMRGAALLLGPALQVRGGSPPTRMDGMDGFDGLLPFRSSVVLVCPSVCWCCYGTLEKSSITVHEREVEDGDTSH